MPCEGDNLALASHSRMGQNHKVYAYCQKRILTVENAGKSDIQTCSDGVVVIAMPLFPEVPGSIPERGKKRWFL